MQALMDKIIERLQAELPEGTLEWSAQTRFAYDSLAVRYKRSDDDDWVGVTFELDMLEDIGDLDGEIKRVAETLVAMANVKTEGAG